MIFPLHFVLQRCILATSGTIHWGGNAICPIGSVATGLLVVKILNTAHDMGIGSTFVAVLCGAWGVGKTVPYDLRCLPTLEALIARGTAKTIPEFVEILYICHFDVI